jgi:hypothetical protein
MVLVGVLLIGGVGVVAVEAVGYRRGGYNSAFWQLPLDDKLDQVALHRREWWWVGVWELAGLFLVTGGVAGLAALLGSDDEPVLASVALGGYLVALFAWVFGLMVQTAAGSQAAVQRAETGATPAWVHPLWEAAYLGELAWIIGSNLAYAVLGIAIIQSGLVGAWAGWVALGLGVLISVAVAATRFGFPQLGLIVPFVLGVALIIEAV